MKVKSPSLFTPAPFFMVRTPFLPMQDFLALSSDEKIQEQEILLTYMREPLFREAIALASPSLYAAMLNRKEGDKIPSSLLRYFLRMISRSTPFGLFSFVSFGAWGQTSTSVFDLNLVQKHVRPDMEWLSNVIDLLSSNPSLNHFFPVRKNPFLSECAGRVFLNYFKQKEENKTTQTVSIRSSFLTQTIFEFTDRPISIPELKTKILERLPDLVEDKLQEVIENLLRQQFLYFALFPSLLQESPFSEVLSHISSSASPTLYRIATDIEDYQQLSAGQGEEQLKKLQHHMESVVPSTHYLQVDTTYPEQNITLPDALKNELKDAVEILWKLSSLKPLFSPLHAYHEKFLEKYGTQRIIPLSELLSDHGLGIPPAYLNEFSDRKMIHHPEKEKWLKWLQGQWALCLMEGRQEIDLPEKILQEILKESELKNIPFSFDLHCEIIADNVVDIDQGNYLVLILSQVLEGGATLGRFLNLLGKDATNQLQTFLREEENLEEETLFLQSSYFPKFSRQANVAICPKLRQYTIDMEGTGTYSLSDIYVGANLDRLYLTLKEGSKELIVTSGNRLISLHAPLPLRFMRDVSCRKNQLFYSFPWLDLETAPFLPRVKFKKTILTPAQWKVDCFQLGIAQNESLQTIEKHFQTWSQKWKIPQYFFISEGDHRILINRQHSSQMREIYSQLKKGIEVKLTEKIKQTEGQWVKSQKGTHFSEFVIPFVRNKHSSSVQRFPIPPYISVPTSLRLKVPGSEWLFLKIYLGIDNENRFLIEQCVQLNENLLKQNIIFNWFFIRYNDPHPHLRIRFVGEKEQILLRLVPIIQEWSAWLLEKQYIHNVSFATYEREVERYGGEELIESAEMLFCADTATTTTLLSLMLGKKLNLAEETLTALSILDLLKQLGLNMKDQLAFFKMQQTPKEELKGFREWKRVLLTESQAIFDEVASPQQEEFLKAFQLRHEALKQFKIKLQEIKEQKKLTTSLHHIYNSILHMHCNRLLGRDRKKENKARLYAYHTLIALNEKFAAIKNH